MQRYLLGLVALALAPVSMASAQVPPTPTPPRAPHPVPLEPLDVRTPRLRPPRPATPRVRAPHIPAPYMTMPPAPVMPVEPFVQTPGAIRPLPPSWGFDARPARDGLPRRPQFYQGDPADSLYRAAYSLFTRQVYRPAADRFSSVRSRYPNSRYVCDAAYYEAF